MERAETIGTCERAWQKRQKTRRDMQRLATPDAPECVDPRRRCTRHDHRTCCGGSRGSASLPVATTSANQIVKSRGCSAEMQSIRPA